jgi:TetR/AcrR family transcriptional regulator, transcriptional repressor for nem operon
LRVSKEQAAENRRRILAAAARLFRERGIDGTGVDAITEAAGLTHGAFYSQFGSKEAVVSEALRLATEESRRLLEGLSKKGRSEALARFVKAYLAPSHRDAPGTGCAIAALGPDVARQSNAVRDRFTEALEGTLETLADLCPGTTAPQRREEAIALFSELLGALILARAVSDESLSRRILTTAANRLSATTRRESPGDPADGARASGHAGGNSRADRSRRRAPGQAAV